MRIKQPRNQCVVRELAYNYWALQAWDGLYELLPELKSRVTVEEETQIYQHQLGQGKVAWETIPKALKTSLLTPYVMYLIKQGAFEEAENRLRRALKKTWRGEWVLLYGQCAYDPPQQLQVAEHWLSHHTEDPDLFACLGRLCVLNQLWGKAQHYFEASVALKPCSKVYRYLGDLLEQRGDRDAALEFFKLATEK